jgi:hypothetical protein
MKYDFEGREITGDVLRNLPRDDQKGVMEAWFRQNYEDPAENTPFESAEGGYRWMDGPHDAAEELRGQFDGVVPEDVIQELADSLDAECPQWAGVLDDDDFGLYDAVLGNTATLATFREAVQTIRKLVKANVGKEEQQHLLNLLFANAIAALETFLCDTFIHRVMSQPHELRRFIETTPQFKKLKIPYAAVLKEAEGVHDTAKRHLLGMVWHRLETVEKLYWRSLKVSVKDLAASLKREIQVRHDIVHRNGKDKEGNAVSVTAADVHQVIAKTDSIATEIDRQLRDIDDCELDSSEV